MEAEPKSPNFTWPGSVSRMLPALTSLQGGKKKNQWGGDGEDLWGGDGEDLWGGDREKSWMRDDEDGMGHGADVGESECLAYHGAHEGQS